MLIPLVAARGTNATGAPDQGSLSVTTSSSSGIDSIEVDTKPGEVTGNRVFLPREAAHFRRVIIR
jgi:hypothetical protein